MPVNHILSITGNSCFSSY